MAAKLIVAFILIVGLILVICLSVIIFLKKSIRFKYYQPKQQVRLFDYMQDFDGNWLFYKIDYDKLIREQPDDVVDLKRKIALIRMAKGLAIIAGWLLVVIGIVAKCLDIL